MKYISVCAFCMSCCKRCHPISLYVRSMFLEDVIFNVIFNWLLKVRLLNVAIIGSIVVVVYCMYPDRNLMNVCSEFLVEILYILLKFQLFWSPPVIEHSCIF